ncbi:hypothetical protein [Aliiroseovarius sp.]|uniref:hypothetical protein n=1 Tax=Aliiroseovarius sp. TaxID=1872442 RepID=UPI003BA8650E
MRYLWLFLILPLPALADTLCVTNASDTRHFFAVASDSGKRAADWLAPGAQLCLDTKAPGTVSVYEEDDAFEGCSRRLPPGGAEQMHAYAPFDRCTWAVHLN